MVECLNSKYGLQGFITLSGPANSQEILSMHPVCVIGHRPITHVL